MNETKLNKPTIEFVEKLKANKNIQGIILFGSWARGDNRPDSDVDLVVIIKEGYKRAVEEFNGQMFEIIYVTDKGAYDFWKSHLDDAYFLWDVAQIIFDRDGSVSKLETKTKRLLKKGKEKTHESQLEQLKFDALDQINAAANLVSTDSTTANLILHNKVFNLSELFFDIRGKWTAPPKQRLSAIKEIDKDIYQFFEEFYANNASFALKIRSAKEIFESVFDI